MELQSNNLTLESDGLFNEQEFSISEQDMGLIFELLRSKMYQNPIGSICREVASNSRDANRENGKGDVPIEISIVQPNQLFSIADLSICFSDNGVGISPSRMTNVFLKYAASTKRDTNNFTGGFGLGAKTPFAYTDLFHIITVYDGEKYHYVSFIDPSQKGKISLFSKEKTDESSGTKIVVPIKNNSDKQTFENEVKIATQFWDVKPKLIGFQNGYTPVKNIRKLKNAQIVEYASNNDNTYIACIDGISYVLNNSILKLSNLSNYQTKVILNFPNGVLNISSNRETLQYDQPTIDTLTTRLTAVVEEIAEILNAEIQKQPTVLKALGTYIAIQSYNDENNLKALYKVYTTLGLAKGIVFNYKGTDLVKLAAQNFNGLGFMFQTINSDKPTDMNWTDGKVLTNPIYYNEGKADARRTKTLLTKHPQGFTIVTLGKLKAQVKSWNQVAKTVEEVRDERIKQMQKFRTYGEILNFEDVERAEIEKDPTKKTVKPDYTQIPVRVAMGSATTSTILPSWGSLPLKYDKANQKFIFEKYQQVIYFTTTSLNDLDTSDLAEKAALGQILSFFLQLPVVVVNERHQAAFKDQLTLQDAVKLVKKESVAKMLDHIAFSKLDVEDKQKIWKYLSFPKDIQASIDYLVKFNSSLSYKGPHYESYSNPAGILQKAGFKQTDKMSTAIAEAAKIANTYPLVYRFRYYDFNKDGKLAKELQEYINKK